jgi:hypothetical protein
MDGLDSLFAFCSLRDSLNGKLFFNISLDCALNLPAFVFIIMVKVDCVYLYLSTKNLRKLMEKLYLILPLLALFSCQSGGMKVAQKYNNWENFTLQSGSRTPSSDVGSDVLIENGRIALEKCGGSNGYATMQRNHNGDMIVSVFNVNCNYFKTQFMSVEDKISTYAGNSDKSSSFRVDETVPGWHELVIGSKAFFKNPQPGSKADRIYYYVPARTVNVDLYLQDSSNSYAIPGCGGYVRAKISNGAVNVIFSDVQNCDSVTMYKDGEERTYQLQNQGHYNGGSYTIPRDFIDFGSNWVNFQIYRKFSSEARIRVNFFGL